MGVPLVTLNGRTVVSRGGASVLNVVGLAELVAGSEDEYVAIAARLASDLDRLEALRGMLRGRVSSSSLTDALRFTRDLEAAYRQMWQAWCRGARAP
jgi:protein O-GlcNAc transferase